MDVSSLVAEPLDLPLLILAALYALSLRPWRPIRMFRNRVVLVDALFVCSLAVGWASLHHPAPFVDTAQFLVDQTDLPETLEAIDDRIEEIEELPEQLWRDLKEHLGLAVEPPAPLPVAGQGTEPSGRVEAAILPAVVDITEGVLRCTAYAVGLLALLLCQALRGVAGIRRAVGDGRPTRQALEERVTALEESLARLHTLPGDAARTLTSGPG